MEFRNRNSFQIKTATREDADSIMKLLKEIARWMKENEIAQWQFLLEGGDDEEIINAIESKDTYVMVRGGELVATFTLSAKQSEWDTELWGEDSEADSHYLHRLAVNRDYKNQGLGSAILSWIQENSSFTKKYIKLDCVAHNEKLNRFYSDNGFEYVGENNGHSKFQKLKQRDGSHASFS